MIKSFSAKNIRNFNELNIDFSIKKSKRNGEYTNDDDFFKTNNDKILKIIGVTGANASGKTTLLEILTSYTWWTYPYSILKTVERKVNQYFTMREIDFLQNNNSENIKKPIMSIAKWMNSQEYINKLFEEFILYFRNLFDVSCFTNDKPIIYNVEYINKKHQELEHSIEINRNGSIIYKLINKSTKKMIIDENFDYSISSSSIIGIQKNPIFSTFSLNIETSYICASQLFDYNFLSIENFLNPYVINHRDEVNSHMFNYLKYSKDNKSKFIEWLQIADKSIIDIVFNSRLKKIDFFMKKNGDKIDWTRLSKGTLKWIYFFYMLYINKLVFGDEYENTDKIIFIDEIDNYLHRKLVKAILRIILTNKNNIQLVFTTHNPNLFDNTFRHQAIYLIEENYDNYNESYNLQCLSKYDLKKDKLISKLFLDEKISSHPDGSLILDWIDKYDE